MAKRSSAVGLAIVRAGVDVGCEVGYGFAKGGVVKDKKRVVLGFVRVVDMKGGRKESKGCARGEVDREPGWDERVESK